MTTRGLSGMLPNIYYRSVDMDRLRAHPNFVALPPVDSVTFVGPPSYRHAPLPGHVLIAEYRSNPFPPPLPPSIFLPLSASIATTGTRSGIPKLVSLTSHLANTNAL